MPNKLDRNASSLNRLRRNMQRLSQGALTSTITSRITAIAPITGGGPIKGNPSIGIAQASSTTNGYLSSTDWNTFFGRQPTGNYVSTSRLINTAAPLTGGGDLSADRTLSIPAATSTANGYLSSTDWNAFHNASAGGPFLSSSTQISAVSPLTVNSGGLLSTGTVAISIGLANAGNNGYLNSADWNTFNNKIDSTGVFPVVSADPGSPSDGRGWYNSTSGSFKVRQLGVTLGDVHLGYAPSADGALVATTSTFVATYVSPTFPANFWSAGKSMRIAWGALANTAAPGVIVYASPVYTPAGGTSTGLDGGAQGVVITNTASNIQMHGEIDVTCRTTGSTGTFAAIGDLVSAGASIIVNPFVTATTIDTTKSFTISLQFRFSSVAGGDNAIGKVFTVSFYDAP